MKPKRVIIAQGTLITPEQILPQSGLVVEGQKIAALFQGDYQIGDDDIFIDASDKYVIPGMIDVHMHGALGYDVMDATNECLQAMARFCVRAGVTSFFPTTISSFPDKIQKAISIINGFRDPEGASIIGIHIEGPYLNSRFRGAQPDHFLRNPSINEYSDWFEHGPVRLITIAPELPGSLELIDSAIKNNVEIAVGHSEASYEELGIAVDHGLRHSTHTFNGMLGLHHRNPGTVGRVLTDNRIYAHIIADGIHLHPAIVNLVVRAKTPHRTILITDSVRPTGLNDGGYELAGEITTVKDGVPRTASGGLAGSTLTMDQALRNTVVYTGIPINDAVRMATSTPAKAIKVESHKGSLVPGMDADIVIMDKSMHVQLTMVMGNIVHNLLN